MALWSRLLWEHKNKWPTTEDSFELVENDQEVRNSAVVMAISKQTTSMSFIAERVSEQFVDCYQTKRVIARCTKFVKILKDHIRRESNNEGDVNCKDLEEAGLIIIRSVQAETFLEELKA